MIFEKFNNLDLNFNSLFSVLEPWIRSQNELKKIESIQIWCCKHVVRLNNEGFIAHVNIKTAKNYKTIKNAYFSIFFIKPYFNTRSLDRNISRYL